MIESHRKSVEFEASIDASGKITIPKDISTELGVGPVHVRLTAKSINAELKQLKVSEEEIERIGSLQLESREQVVTFLLSEGALNRVAGKRTTR